MTEHYEKIAFVWDQPGRRTPVPDRLSFRPFTTVEYETFIGLVAGAMNGSLDRKDRKATRELGALRAARAFIEDAGEAFEYQQRWWQLAMDTDGQLIGFILPVLFRDAEKDGLGEGTFYYLGISPEYRGNHYGYDLLCFGTAILQEVGVWRIFSDTDVLNTPMIKAFQEVGYRQFGSLKKVPF